MLSLLFPAKVITNSEIAARELNGQWWLKHIQYHYFPNYIDLKQFRSSGVPKKFTSVSVGSLLPEKRLHRLIALIQSAIAAEHEVKHIHLGDGPLRAKLKTLTEQSGVSQHLEFAGNKRNIADYLSESQLFLHFSDFEGTPNVVLEAMACGLPVITTRCGDVEKLVIDGLNGYVLPHGSDYDANLYLDKYLNLISNPKIMHEMGTASFEHIQKNDIRNMAGAFNNLVTKISR